MTSFQPTLGFLFVVGDVISQRSVPDTRCHAFLS